MNMNTYPHHPAADLFPLLQGEDLRELADDIAEHGLNSPVWLYDDRELGTVVLDGRNRLAACAMAGVEPKTQYYLGDDPIGFSVSENLKRRHLSPSQKAMVTIEVLALYEAEAKRRMLAGVAPTEVVDPEANWPQGLESPKRAPQARDRAAKVTGASGRAVGRAKRVVKEAPDLVEKIRNGELALDKAEKTIKRRHKAAKVAEIQAQEPAPLASIGPFPVLYVDPPWRYEHSEEMRQIENHYPTMSLDEIKGIDLPACADAVLFMWVTSPKLAEGIDVLRAWNFSYRTSMVWVKDRIGMGYYARQRHELLLIARRGTLPVPDPEDRPDSVIEAPRGEHSAKPDVVYTLIERMYPAHERVELFQRRPRNGWAGWGNQVGATL